MLYYYTSGKNHCIPLAELQLIFCNSFVIVHILTSASE
jgi:hypothetical protein